MLIKVLNILSAYIGGGALKKYKQVLAGYKDSEKGIDGDKWSLQTTKDVTME